MINGAVTAWLDSTVIIFAFAVTKWVRDKKTVLISYDSLLVVLLICHKTARDIIISATIIKKLTPFM